MGQPLTALERAQNVVDELAINGINGFIRLSPDASAELVRAIEGILSERDALRHEVERLRLLETMWKARVAWASAQGDGPTERANWEAYDKAREAYEAVKP